MAPAGHVLEPQHWRQVVAEGWPASVSKGDCVPSFTEPDPRSRRRRLRAAISPPPGVLVVTPRESALLSESSHGAATPLTETGWKAGSSPAGGNQAWISSDEPLSPRGHWRAQALRITGLGGAFWSLFGRPSQLGFALTWIPSNPGSMAPLLENLGTQLIIPGFPLALVQWAHGS